MKQQEKMKKKCRKGQKYLLWTTSGRRKRLGFGDVESRTQQTNFVESLNYLKQLQRESERGDGKQLQRENYWTSRMIERRRN